MTGVQTCALPIFFLGGVPKRFPKLNFSFLEGGVAWGLSLFSGLLGVYEKRNLEAMEHLNPKNLDRPLLVDLLGQYGTKPIEERLDRIDEGFLFLHDPDDPGSDPDEFAESGISGPEDIEQIFRERFFFGCEADDPMNALAFSRKINPRHIELQAVFASDIGHWDVADFRDVLPEAWELIEKELLDLDQFQRFMGGNVVSCMKGANPAYFEGTVVSDFAEGVGIS